MKRVVQRDLKERGKLKKRAEDDFLNHGIFIMRNSKIKI